MLKQASTTAKSVYSAADYNEPAPAIASELQAYKDSTTAAVEAFLASGGKIDYLPYRGPAK